MLENADNFSCGLCYQVLEVGSDICEAETHMAGMKVFSHLNDNLFKF